MKDSEVNTSKTLKIKKVSIETINVSNMSLQRIINESSTKQQGNINVSEITTTKGFSSLISASKSSRFHQLYSNNHQQRLINAAAMSYQNLKISTLKILMIKNVCIQIFVVSSMFKQGVINESSMKKQWNINDSEVNTTESIKINKFPSKLSMFQLCLSKESSRDHRSSNQASMFRRLPQQKNFYH